MSSIITSTKWIIKEFDKHLELMSECESSNRLKFYYVWLRDHCTCKTCYNSLTNQRSLNIIEIPLNIKPSLCITHDDILKITWDDGHITNYSLEWLENINFPLQTEKQVILWDQSNIGNFSDTKVPIDVYLQNDDGPKRLFMSLLKYGIGFVTGVEPTMHATEMVVKHLAPIQKTYFGEMWQVTNEDLFSDTSYTTGALGVHNDNTYFNEAAGLQVFHMLSYEGTGGESLFVDGFNAAYNLKNKNADAYETLQNAAIESQYIDKECYFSTIQPVIKLHPVTKELQQIRYNIYDRGILHSIPHEKVFKYYEAYQALGREITNPNNEFWIKLTPGSVIFFDNWRILHGRSAYSGKRLIGGCYINRSEWLSKAKFLGLPVV